MKISICALLFISLSQLILAQCEEIQLNFVEYADNQTFRVVETKEEFIDLFSGKFSCSDSIYSTLFGSDKYLIIFIDDTLCIDKCYTFNPLNSFENNESYELLWYFNEAFPDMYKEDTPNVTYYIPGNYYSLYTPSTCSGWATFAFHVNYCPPISNFTSSATSICVGETVTFKDNSEKAPENWHWEFEGADTIFSNDTIVDIKYSIPGIYDVQLIVSNSAGIDTLYVEDYITVLPAPIITSNSFNYQVNTGESLELIACDTLSDYTYDWQPVINLSCSNCPNPILSPVHDTQYTLTIQQDNIPCQTQCFYNITVIPSGIIVPSAFSPNNDGVNDILQPISSLAEILYFAIYNRWGQRIYQGGSDSIAWNGVFKGENVPIGSYIWIVEYLPKGSNTVKLEQGVVALIR